METLADYYNFILVVELFFESVPEPFILKMYLNTAVTKLHQDTLKLLIRHEMLILCVFLSEAPQVIRKIRSETFADASGHLKLWCQFFNVLTDSTIRWFRNEEEIAQVKQR